MIYKIRVQYEKVHPEVSNVYIPCLTQEHEFELYIKGLLQGHFNSVKKISYSYPLFLVYKAKFLEKKYVARLIYFQVN